jgi:hypothetical protein
MWVHRWTLRIADMLFDDFELAWSHHEIESNLAKELDFKNEAQSKKIGWCLLVKLFVVDSLIQDARRTKANFENNPNMYVPISYDDLSSTKVLSMYLFLFACCYSSLTRKQLWNLSMALRLLKLRKSKQWALISTEC